MLSVEKKRGKDTLAAAYGIKDEAATLSWTHKPFKVRPRHRPDALRPGSQACPHAAQMQVASYSWRPPRWSLHMPAAAAPQVVLRGKAGQGGVKGVNAAVTLTHEFEI